MYLFHNFVCDCCRCSNINELSSFFVEDTLKSLSCSLPYRDLKVIKCPGFWLLKNGFPIHIPRPPPSKLVKCKHGSDTQIQYWVKQRDKHYIYSCSCSFYHQFTGLTHCIVLVSRRHRGSAASVLCPFNVGNRVRPHIKTLIIALSHFRSP